MRFALLGNSGAGKSTLATSLADAHGCPILDLDTVYWHPDQPAVQRPLVDASRDVSAFCEQHAAWVVEGCYEVLVATALQFDPELNLPRSGRRAMPVELGSAASAGLSERVFGIRVRTGSPRSHAQAANRQKN